ncbi:sugar-binding domain-containing protein, partial [Pseudoalteromonas sp. SIMBA_148]
LDALQRAGAVGEIVGWSFDANGVYIEGGLNERVASAPLPSSETSLVIAAAMGARKLPAITAAVSRHIVNGLITDECTATALL